MTIAHSQTLQMTKTEPLMSERRTSLIGAFMTMVGSISMSLYTPAMPALAHAFGVSGASAKMTLTFYFAGFAVAQLVTGPASDAIGRRKAAIIFMLVYLAGSLMAVFAPTIEWLMAARLIQAKAGACFLAGGVESVSTAPWRVERPKANGALPRFYGRARFSPETVGDPDMGIAAENVAREFAISRERQDEFALRSHRLAVAAAEAGAFRPEIVGIATGHGLIERDECPRPTTSLEALANLRPAFLTDGTVTAGNACPVNDGACLVLVMSRGMARRLGIEKGLAFIDSAAAEVGCSFSRPETQARARHPVHALSRAGRAGGR